MSGKLWPRVISVAAIRDCLGLLQPPCPTTALAFNRSLRERRETSLLHYAAGTGGGSKWEEISEASPSQWCPSSLPSGAGGPGPSWRPGVSERSWAEAPRLVPPSCCLWHFCPLKGRTPLSSLSFKHANKQAAVCQVAWVKSQRNLSVLHLAGPPPQGLSNAFTGAGLTFS